MRVAGFGYRSGATIASLRAAWALAGGADRLATAEDKAGSLAHAFADALGLPLVAVPPDLIASQTATLSRHAPARYGGRGLAEAAALAAAGPGARLIVGRVVSADRMATMAVAEGPGT